MSFDKQDIEILRAMFAESKRETRGMIEDNNHVILRMMRDETRSLIAASENRMLHRMDEMKKEFVREVNSLVSTSILPQIDDLQHYMKRVKGKLKPA